MFIMYSLSYMILAIYIKIYKLNIEVGKRKLFFFSFRNFYNLFTHLIHLYIYSVYKYPFIVQKSVLEGI